MFSRLAPKDWYKRVQEIAAAPAPLTTMRTSWMFFSAISKAFNKAAADIVALNAGAAIYVAGKADSLADGVQKAQAILVSGDALLKLEKLVALSNSLAS